MGVSRLALLGRAACGSVSAPAQPDATPDVPMIDAPAPGPVAVPTQPRIPGGPPAGTALGNISLVAVRPDGTLADMQTTDATTGMATLNAYDGDSVTALYPHMNDAGADLTTFMGVKHGDSLTFGLRFNPSGSNTTLGSLTLTWPALSSSSYEAFTACTTAGFGTATSGSITEYSLCHRDPMDVVMEAYDTNTGAPLQTGLISNITFADGGSATLPQWSPVTTAKSLSFTGLPTEVTSISTLIYEYVNDRIFYSDGFSGAPSNGQYTTPAFTWPGVGSHEWVRAVLSRPGPWTSMYIMDSAAPTPQPYTNASPMLP